MSVLTLTKTRIQAGAYEAVLSVPEALADNPRLEMHHLGKPVGRVQLTPDPKMQNLWNVSAKIPADVLTDGVQAFSLIDLSSEDTLDSFTIVTGEPLEDDIRAEVTLLRAELDMLKKAFRRHCVETMG